MPEKLTIEHYADAVQAAADAFGLQAAELRPISMTENVVFRLREAQTGQLYALRLHRPGYHALDTLVSERDWTTALADKGMVVPTGRRAANGDWYVPIATPDPGGFRHAGVTIWHEGQTLESRIGSDRGPETWPWFHRLGALLGELHTHTRNWVIPSGFVRHRLDIDGLVGETPFWGRFWDSALLDDQEKRLLLSAREWATARLYDLQANGALFGLIHADSHLDNVLISGDRLGLIDFDDCCYGWLAFDMCVALHSSWGHADFASIRDHFLAGYEMQHALQADILQQLDLFLLLRSLQLVSWREMRPDIAANLRKELWMPKLAQDIQKALAS